MHTDEKARRSGREAKSAAAASRNLQGLSDTAVAKVRDYLVGISGDCGHPNRKASRSQDQPRMQEGTASKVLEAKPATEPQSANSSARAAPVASVRGNEMDSEDGQGIRGHRRGSSSTA